MNKVLTTLLILGYAFLFSACEKNEPAGPTVTVTKDLSDFSELEISGAMELEIIEGLDADIRIIAPDNLQRYIEAFVFSDRLTIQERDNNIKRADVRIEISETALSRVVLVGAGNVYGDSLKSERIAMELQGSGNIDLPVDCEQLNTRITGSGRIKAAGNAESSEAVLEGSGSIDLKNVEAREGRARITGSGSIDIYADSTIFARIDGSGTIRYWGNPESTDTDVSGSGSIIRIN